MEETAGVEIRIEKYLPVAAGMAGGSTDAAAVLYGVNRLFRMGLLTAAFSASAYTIYAEIHPEMLISIFLDHPTQELVAMCIPGIRIVSPGYIAAGITTVCNVYMESTLRPRSAARVAVVQGFISPIASVLILVPFLGTQGVWIAFLIAELISLAIAIHTEKASRIGVLPDDGEFA